MFKNFPEIGQPLTQEHVDFLKTFSKSCRGSILKMVTNAQSGHPGGSLSCIDYLTLIYCFIISQTGEKIAVSNGHISPGVYSVLAELGYIHKEEVIAGFRKIGSIYEGHITRHVDGVWYGTGPLGIGVSVATSFALAERLAEQLDQKSPKKVFALAGDGECQEGQVHEMINFSKQHKLDNLILFVDYNKIQLTAGLAEIIDIDIAATFKAGGWHVIEVDGHDYSKLWKALGEAYKVQGKPIVLVADTTMGQGVDFMEAAAKTFKADWHGKAPKPEEIEPYYEKFALTAEETKTLENFRKNLVKWKPAHAKYPKLLEKIGPATGHSFRVDTGEPTIYPTGESIDCRTSYGKALLDLAKRNPKIIALTADLKGSVMTKFVAEELPAQYFECGIAEQHMVSTAGGFSLVDFIPFASTFGAFMTSRAKDQARVNDINHTNVKMVATHCGLSVGEDGPTHQAIDDMGSFLGFFNTMVIEPADPNQTDHIIRYIASHYGNFYVRMGRHKFPILTKEDGTPFYDANYQYEYGRCDVIRQGQAITIAASGAMVGEALKAREIFDAKNPTNANTIEIVAVSSIKKFDQTLINSIKKTRKVITVEDHNSLSGLGGQLARHLAEHDIATDLFKTIAPREYQLSGKADELYRAAKIDAEAIAETAATALRD